MNLVRQTEWTSLALNTSNRQQGVDLAMVFARLDSQRLINFGHNILEFAVAEHAHVHVLYGENLQREMQTGYAEITYYRNQ